MSVSEAQDRVLRRVRSVGDLPRRPERAYIHSSSRVSEPESTSDPYDFASNETRRIRSMPPGAQIIPTATSSLPPLPLDTNASSSPTLQTQIFTLDRQLEPQIALHVKILSFFGLGRRATRERKSLVSVIWNILWGFVQFVVIVPILILTATHFRSASDPTLSEWTACNRPLGVWASVWLIRVLLASILSYWDFRRDRILHSSHASPAETEAGVINTTGATDPISDASVNGTSANGASTTPPGTPTLPNGVLNTCVTLLCSLMTLIWFLTTHILEFTSIKTCRATSPHLWWLVFGILCTIYLMLLEIVMLVLFVVVIGPILFIFWNILLICVGRHPFQHPNIKPEIGKLAKSVVDRIPLVIYIPPPPEGVKSAVGGSPHSYPPKFTTSSQPRFKLLRRFRKKKDLIPQTASDEKNDRTVDMEGSMFWEANWELGEYPFVALEENRAACAICLMDFEEPKRRVQAGEGSSNPRDTSRAIDNVIVTDIPTGEDQDKLHLVDAGDAVQPLRLLACSHVFHKTCLDPWLTDVSGRCPTCQRAVEMPKPSNKKPRRTS